MCEDKTHSQHGRCFFFFCKNKSFNPELSSSNQNETYSIFKLSPNWVTLENTDRKVKYKKLLRARGDAFKVAFLRFNE
jgi:hypothetical protein